ncbi:unnamed protein product [Sympodiomycopsis kandeliae]
MSSSTKSENNSATSTSTSTSQEPPPQSQPEGQKKRTLYNTFLSPSGSTSFFTFSWFESAPIKKGTKKLASEMGLASSDPSSSTDSSQLPPGAAKPLKRRPSYEEYRSEEPPQARLIRLRGLFDVLMDKDQHDALADGRAKEAWRATARTARYGAGGNLARGSLAKEMHIDRHMSTKEFELDADNTSSNSSKSTAPPAATASTSPPTSSSSSSSSSSSLPSQPSPPRQSYAKELLTQCRQCRLDLEQERTKRSKSTATGESTPSLIEDASSDSDSSSSWYKVWPFNSSSSSDASVTSSVDSQTSADQQNSSFSSLWYSIAGSPQCTDEKELEADYDGESGYTGSGVWGLSAVKGGLRDRERQRLQSEHQQQQQQPSTAESESEDGHQRTMIEWEGFLKYAELKERELYKIFAELDRNCDMRLDVAEIRTALDKAGIDLPPALLDDFIASLSSSTHTADPHARVRGVDLWHSPRELQPTQYISWPEFRDYLLLLPRKPSVGEIFKFYQVRKAFGLFGIGGIFSEFGSNWGSDRHSATSVTSDGDVSFGAEETKSKGSSDQQQSKKSATSSGKEDSTQQQKASSASGSTSGGSGTDASKGDDGKSSAAAGAAAATVSSSSSSSSSSGGSGGASSTSSSDNQDSQAADHSGHEEEEEEDNDMIHSDVALKFLLAGGIAGAVSRTATAPFDRLKIYLITASRSDETATSQAIETVKKSGASGASKEAGKLASRSMGMLGTAVQTLYREGGGLKAFWLGNGLNCMKIFPESAIKFLSYETSKRAFAKYVDHVSDSRDISGTSRFISGGVGGITSQLAIYPVETLKTRLMSSQGTNAPLSSTGQRLVGNELLFATAKQMWTSGGMRIYYRGLVAGLVGVFPYSAIDMSTFEGIKLAYISYTGKEDPGTLALLSFGSISGSVGATTVYPLNLIRTRLQASGTPSHPIIYKGFMDAVLKTYRKEGIVGFYRGLIPTLAKVVPAVSISYVCYENSKKRLGVA